MSDNKIKIKYNNCSKCGNELDYYSRIKGSNNAELYNITLQKINFLFYQKKSNLDNDENI